MGQSLAFLARSRTHVGDGRGSPFPPRHPVATSALVDLYVWRLGVRHLSVNWQIVFRAPGRPSSYVRLRRPVRDVRPRLPLQTTLRLSHFHLLVAGTGGEAAGRALPLGAVVGRVDCAVRGSVFLVDMWASDHCSLGSMAMTPALHASWSQASKSMEALSCCPAGSGTPVLQRQVVQTSTRSCEPLTAHSGHTCLLPLGTWKTGTSGCHPEVCRLAVCTTGSHPVYRRSAE